MMPRFRFCAIIFAATTLFHADADLFHFDFLIRRFFFMPCHIRFFFDAYVSISFIFCRRTTITMFYVISMPLSPSSMFFRHA